MSTFCYSIHTVHHLMYNDQSYLSAMLVHKALYIHTDSTGALIQNGELWFVVEETRHLHICDGENAKNLCIR